MTTATQPAAPAAAALQRCRPHDWARPKAADSKFTCRVCDRELHFSVLHPDKRQTPHIYAAILSSVEHRRGPAEAAVFRACLDRFYAGLFEPHDPTGHVTEIVRVPLRQQRLVEDEAQRAAQRAAPKRSRCARRRERSAQRVAQRQAGRQGAAV